MSETIINALQSLAIGCVLIPFERGNFFYKPKRDKQAMATTSGTAEGQHLPSRSIFSGDIC